MGRRTGLSLSGTDLGKGRLDLGVERVSSHDEDNRHVLVDKCEGTVLEFSSEDTLTVHVGYLLDLESTFETRSV